MQVIHKLEWPGKNEYCDKMWDPMKLPGYHPERFPFVIVRGSYGNYYLVNIKEYIVQTLIKAKQERQGVCIALTD